MKYVIDGGMLVQRIPWKRRLAPLLQKSPGPYRTGPEIWSAPTWDRLCSSCHDIASSTSFIVNSKVSKTFRAELEVSDFASAKTIFHDLELRVVISAVLI